MFVNPMAQWAPSRPPMVQWAPNGPNGRPKGPVGQHKHPIVMNKQCLYSFIGFYKFLKV